MKPHHPYVMIYCQKYCYSIMQCNAHWERNLRQYVHHEEPLFRVYLYVQGAAKEVRGEDADTPLHCAADEGRLPVVQYLCAHGADKEVRGSNGNTLLCRHNASFSMSRSAPLIPRSMCTTSTLRTSLVRRLSAFPLPPALHALALAVLLRVFVVRRADAC